MSAGVVYRHVLGAVRSAALPSDAERDIVACLEAPRPGPLELLYELGYEADLTRDVLLDRAGGAYLSFAAGNLADDMIDGDCDYLERPAVTAPSVQFSLQHLGYWLFARCGTPPALVAEFARQTGVAGAAEHIEVEESPWTRDRFERVAEGIAGRQWIAYLTVLWGDGPRAAMITELGRALGIAAHVGEDIRTKDPRFFGLPLVDRRAIRAATRESLECLERSPSRVLNGVAVALRPVVDGEENEHVR